MDTCYENTLVKASLWYEVNYFLMNEAFYYELLVDCILLF